MIIFHEGLPGSGKSFAAMVDHICPALLKGRTVYAYVEGLDHARIAEAAGVPLHRVEQLLIPVKRDDVLKIPSIVANDALVVIDELANFFPSGRQKLSDEWTIFIKEHRHRGLDLLVMDQVMNDCHALWKGRVDTLIRFRKLDAVGKPDSYKVEVCKQDSSGKYKAVSSSSAPYDPKYFGCYRSHAEGTENTETYVDERANVWNSPAVKMLKRYGVVVLIALGYIVWFFSTGGGFAPEEKPKPKPQAVTTTPLAPPPSPSAGRTPTVPGTAPDIRPASRQSQLDDAIGQHIDKLTERARPRFAGSVRGVNRMVTMVEWRDESGRLFERLDGAQLEAMGFRVWVTGDGSMAMITGHDRSFVATQWPLQDDQAQSPERVPEPTKRVVSAGAES